MDELSKWKDAQAMSRYEFRESGGCLWPIHPNSPGSGFRIPEGTPFQVRMKGPTDRFEMIPGECKSGKFHVLKGPASGSYVSGNEAVAKTRANVKASNAYLYIEFRVGSEWKLADDIRHEPGLCWKPSQAEEHAMNVLRDLVKKAAREKKKNLSALEIEVIAERNLEKDEKWLKEGERRAEAAESLFKN